MAVADAVSAGVDRRMLGALLFADACNTAFNAFGSLDSSPWTAESFGGDPNKASSCMEYVYHAVGVSIGLSTISAVVAGSWWPIVGIGLTDSYMLWLYRRALRRAQSRGSTSWQG